MLRTDDIPSLADTKVVYRRYASLFFIAGCSSTDNELITLEIVHRYVEQMDKYYGNVCELDIIFNFQKAYFILDELLLAGEMQESSKKNVLRCISQQDSLEDMEASLFLRHLLSSRSFPHDSSLKKLGTAGGFETNRKPLMIRSTNILCQRSCKERYLTSFALHFPSPLKSAVDPRLGWPSSHFRYGLIYIS